jgi:hypothetical protein
MGSLADRMHTLLAPAHRVLRMSDYVTLLLCSELASYPELIAASKQKIAVRMTILLMDSKSALGVLDTP